MTICDRKALRQAADARIAQAAYDPRRLMLISSGISFGLSLLVAVLNHLLYRQVDMHGGLAGMDLRIVLETAALLLQYVQLIFLPFWSMGMFSVALRIARREEALPNDLLNGFRRFGPVLRLQVLQIVVYALIGMACAYTGSMLIILTPLAVPLLKLMEPMLTMATQAQMEEYLQTVDPEAMSQAMLPVMILTGILCVILMIPAFYRLRLANYAIMDEPGMGAFAAMRLSGRCMRRNCMAMFKLDLTFWPYYLVIALATPLAYLDQLLPLLGVQGGLSTQTLFFLGYGGYILITVAAQVWMLHKIRVTEALVYESLLPKKEETVHV